MHVTFIAFNGPHGLLWLIAFVLAILAALPIPAKNVSWWPWSWVFFLAGCMFG